MKTCGNCKWYEPSAVWPHIGNCSAPLPMIYYQGEWDPDTETIAHEPASECKPYIPKQRRKEKP